jgi:prolyl-tRNA editing enzyme YbaK/EbsC (Cys-tRNA(Pro) deacylase)
MTQRTTDDVRRALAGLAPEIEVREYGQSTATSQEAADAIGCELGQIVKSLVFLVDDQPMIVLASGDQRIDDRKLAALYDVSRKKVKVASAEQCIAITGYPPGSVPPVGHATDSLPIWIEDSLQRYTQIYAAAGAPNAIFPTTLDRLTAITGGCPADLKRDSTA